MKSDKMFIFQAKKKQNKQKILLQKEFPATNLNDLKYQTIMHP